MCSYKVRLILIVILLPTVSWGQTQHKASSGYTSDRKAPHGCSVFTISKGNQVFFGGNDDYINPDSYYWVDQGDENSYGVIWIGEPDNVQQGINEHGLAYDANGLPRFDVNPHNERLPVEGSYTSYPIHIMHECATVKEVITWIETHRWHSYMHDQMHFADSGGDAVIVSAGKDGEVVFTRKQRGDGFLVSTNFNVANPSNGFGYPCQRYETAQAMLSELMKMGRRLTVEDAAGVLDAIHAENVTSWTIESFLADLSEGFVYIYYFYQYDKPVVINVQEELANPRDPEPLSMLFPEEVKQEAANRYRQFQDRARRCRWYGMVWIAAVLASLILYSIISRLKKEGAGFWIPAMILMGPFAFLFWIVAGRNHKEKNWKFSVVETTGDVMPSVFSFIVILTIFISLLSLNQFIQLAIFLILPVLIAWLLFHGLLLKTIAGEKYNRIFGRRFPHVLITTNIAVGGIGAFAMPMVNKSLSVCAILPLSAWTIVMFWLIAAFGSVVGCILVYFYELWPVRRGYQAWNISLRNRGKITTAPFRKLWWWIIISYVVMFAGLVVGVISQQ